MHTEYLEAKLRREKIARHHQQNFLLGFCFSEVLVSTFSLKLHENGGKSLLQKLFHVAISSFAASQTNLKMRAHLDVAWYLVRGDQRNYGERFRFIFLKKYCQRNVAFCFTNNSKVLVLTALQVFK
ncbi:hypothetical protein JRQ81_014967 [Phrynocephalus forsythii]|uniref:Uncharacterized protein n=1 Tax=Phrynocephalus forsythii TaxID=171643 RepID=A0A9Q0Y0Y5_9SAUR|nr:hypothetical protein JRQ81_014967 [Phrynocephalus forsythii]